jgi:hypothetical protein
LSCLSGVDPLAVQVVRFKEEDKPGADEELAKYQKKVSLHIIAPGPSLCFQPSMAL